MIVLSSLPDPKNIRPFGVNATQLTCFGRELCEIMQKRKEKEKEKGKEKKQKESRKRGIYFVIVIFT